MVIPQTKERVLVRKQGSPFLAHVTGSVRLDLRKPGAPESETQPGAEIGVEVRDDRGLALFAQRNQIELATPEIEKEFETDLTPRLLKRDWSDPLNLGRIVMTPV